MERLEYVHSHEIKVGDTVLVRCAPFLVDAIRAEYGAHKIWFHGRMLRSDNTWIVVADDFFWADNARVLLLDT